MPGLALALTPRMNVRLASRISHFAARCERRVTPAAFTLSTILLAVACGGGGAKGDTYARGTQVQEQCCEKLSAGRDACLQQVVRVDDKTVAGSSLNQQTFACVVEHFTCDPATGHATRDSAQAQLECIQDLQVSSR